MTPILNAKKPGKLIGMKFDQFEEFVTSNEINVCQPRLIPVYKLGDEMALTSTFLSALRLIKEFRELLGADLKLTRSGKIHVYTEVTFAQCPESRLDGLLLVVKSGVIRDAFIVEVKNGRNALEKEQLERYQQVAKQFAIPKFLTISNEFVSDCSQSPLPLKKVRGVEMRHYSWQYILTMAHVLLYDNDTNIEDVDQVEIMNEVVRYFEHEKSGILGFNQMGAEWTEAVNKINAGANLKVTDKFVYGAAKSWQQEEQDMALILSRELGVFIKTGSKKYKGNLEERLKQDCKSLVDNKRLTSSLRVHGAVSDIVVQVLLDKHVIEMGVSLKPPSNKTLKGQFGWLKRQIQHCQANSPNSFARLEKHIHVEVALKNSRKHERYTLSELEDVHTVLKGKEVREFRIINLKHLGKKFASPRQFVDVVEAMLLTYYEGVVQHLVKWEDPAPQVIKKPQPESDEYESVL